MLSFVIHDNLPIAVVKQIAKDHGLLIYNSFTARIMTLGSEPYFTTLINVVTAMRMF